MIHNFKINNREFLALSAKDGTPGEIAKAIIENNLDGRIYTPIGFYPGMTEGQAAGIVEDCPYFAKCWKHYSPTGRVGVMSPIHDPTISCWTTLESFASKMTAEKIYLVNPYGEKEPEMKDFEYEYDEYYQPEDDFDYDDMQYKSALRDWQDAEDRTSKAYIILGMIKIRKL